MKKTSLLNGFAGIMTALVLLISSPADAQWTNERMQNFNNYNLKNYAVAAFKGQDEYVMAGTMYDYKGTPGNNGIHFIKVDNAGNTIFSKVLSYTDPDKYFWHNLQTVGVHTDADHNIIIVASCQNNYSAGPARNKGIRDGFFVFRFDQNGVLQTSLTRVFLADIFAPDGIGYWNTYPIRTLLDGNNLYVCGYVANDYKPDLLSEKSGFVGRIELTPTSTAAIKLVSFDAPNVYGHDLDMAKGLKMVSSGLWVGGSINGGPALNAILDPLTLNPIFASSFGAPYSAYGAPEVNLNDESFDITEDPNGIGFYVFSNYALASFSGGVVGKHDLPGTFCVTAVKPDLIPYVGVANRVTFGVVDYIWGVNLIPDNLPRASHSVVLSGIQLHSNCPLPAGPTPITLYDSNDDIRPFLFSMSLAMQPGGLNVTDNYFNVLESFVGSGPANQPNSYYQLGGRENLINTPPIAVRDLSSTTDIFMSAPAYWYKFQKLGVKWIRTDQNGELAGCAWQPQCSWTMQAREVPEGITPSFKQESLSFWNQLPKYPVDDLNPDYIYDCSYLYKEAPQSIQNINESPAIEAALYPNPAFDHITLKLKGNFDRNKNLEVDLMDITGKKLRTLYSGSVAGLPSTLPISDIAPGIYLVNMQYEGSWRNTQRLSIK